MSSGDQRATMHGGPRHDELTAHGIDYNDVLDFSVSTNAYGPSPIMLEAIRQASIDRYPERTATGARLAIAAWLDVTERGVVVGNGAADLLWATARALLKPGDPLFVVEPTFGEMRAAGVALGARVIEWRAQRSDGFAVDLNALGDVVRSAGAKVVYLCSPNTPTGVSVNVHALTAWAQRHGDSTLVLDQSFLSLSDDFADRDVSFPGNVVLVRSLTKDHTLPGVRVGYLVTTPRRALEIERQRPAWSASAMAQAATICAATLDDFVATCRERLIADRDELALQLRELGLEPLASRAPFLITTVPDVARTRATLLTDHRILVRDCASFGLPEHIRLGVRPVRDRERLIDGLRAVLR